MLNGQKLPVLESSRWWSSRGWGLGHIRHEDAFVYVCIYIYTHMYIYIYIYICVYICVCTEKDDR